MNKMGKRFIALLVIFTSIMSFLPVKFGGNIQAANAAVSNTSITVGGHPGTAGDNITVLNDVYSTEQVYEYFTITVPNKKYTGNVNNILPGTTEIIDQEIVINKINGIKLDGTLDENNAKLQAIGCSITAGNVGLDNNTIGVKIDKLPLGVNKIEYQIRETTREMKKVPRPTATDPNAYEAVLQDPVVDTYPSSQTTKEITIQHARTFVQSKIESLSFNSYIGKKTDYIENSGINKPPFLFTNIAQSNKDMPLSYTFNVPDSTDTLDYVMTFKDAISGAKVFKNGQQDNATVIDNKVSGTLNNYGQTDIIVIKIDSNDVQIAKAYAIEINYNTLKAENDFTLKDPGITKLNYNEATDVKAFIGNHFEQDTEDKNVLTYTGSITIDKRAEMISLSPLLGRNATDTAFVISNHYNNGSGIANSKQINGKQYVDFNKGTDNEIWIDVYAGKDGNTQGSILARYKLKVNLIDTAPSADKIKFSFGDAYLTQPGRKDEKIDFNLDRRTYDLYSGDTVNVSLDSPRTDKNEYLKVWLGNSTDNDDVTQVANSTKQNSLSVDVSKAKKMVVQAYYDEITYKKDAAGNPTTEIEKVEECPLGVKYVFYIAKNAGNPDGGDTTTGSHNASLSGLKFNNGTLKGADGTSGFLSDKYKYNVTVPKADTETKITATAEDSKAKSITATIAGTSNDYDLTSGEPFELPLNSTGTTDIQIVVTAADGVTKKTYNVTVKNDERSATSKLKNVITNVGDFNFDPNEETTKIRVDQNVTSIKVTPIPEDSKARVTVDGKTFDGAPIAVSLKGSQETDIRIKVTSEDGSTSQSYTLEVYRTNSDINTDDNKDDDKDDVFYDEIDECWVDTSKYEEWGKVDGKQVYFNNKGRQVKNSWISTDGKFYYLGSKGYKATGWRTESDGKSYYLDPSTGEIRKGWIYQNNTWYYLGLNGVMQKGWLYLNGKWYYFTPSGQLITNQSMYIDGKIYNFAQDGSMY